MEDTTFNTISMVPTPLLTMTGHNGSILTVEQEGESVVLRVTDRYGAAVIGVDVAEAWRLAHLLPTALAMLPARQ